MSFFLLRQMITVAAPPTATTAMAIYSTTPLSPVAGFLLPPSVSPPVEPPVPSSLPPSPGPSSERAQDEMIRYRQLTLHLGDDGDGIAGLDELTALRPDHIVQHLAEVRQITVLCICFTIL